MKKHYLLKLLFISMVAALLLAAASPAVGAPEKTRVFVEFTPRGKAVVQRELARAGAEFHYTFDFLNSFVVTLPTNVLNSLSQNPNVVGIEEDVPRYMISTPTSSALEAVAAAASAAGETVPYGVDAVQARDVWDQNKDGIVDSGAPAGAGVTVCIIDSGFYSGHEDLTDVSLVGGTSQVGDEYTTDGLGHGSHVAGTIAAFDNDLGVIGVAPQVSLYIVKFFNNDGLATLASDLIDAAKACESNGAQVISMSLGGSRSNGREQRTFDQLNSSGVLSIAAAGNNGDTSFSYPASYSSVMSVAAVDSTNTIAGFSQQNSQVEIAAPGVGVLSTIPYLETNTVEVNGTTYQANHIEFSARGTASGSLVDGGLCDSSGAWSGAVVLCERGNISFFDKVVNVQNGGGTAAVIYNNEPGNFYGTLGEGNSSNIIALSLSQEDGQALVTGSLGQTANLTSSSEWPASGYAYYNGTSMATPHVSAVAAVLWSANPSASNDDIRNAMNSSAMDLGDAGRDNAYGYGLVQAADAMNALGGGTGNSAPSVSISSPDDGSSFNTGESINFAGSASDDEDGDLSSSISWTSSIDGSIGSEASFTAVLSDGNHTITASVTDSGSLTATATVNVTVGGGGGTGGALDVTVATDKVSYVKGETAIITATVTDGTNPVSDAAVDLRIETPNGRIYSGNGTTDANGQAAFSFRVNPNKDGSGTYNVTATASKTGYTSGTGTTSFTVQ